MEIYIGCSVCAIIFIVILLCVLFNIKNNKIVKENSFKYKQLITINGNTKFFDDFENRYKYVCVCNSKRQLDKLSLYKMLKSNIENQLNFIKNLISKVEENKKLLNAYNKKISTIKSTITEEEAKKLKIKYEKFLNIEETLFNNAKLCPKLQFEIYCYAYYISPQGRNYYHKEYTYTYNQVLDAFNEVTKLIAYRLTKAYQIKLERSKITDSLRYDVLKRDNFKCQLCGASQKDGATLHVDHIIPVSKGGTSDFENLRTLCSRCNLGKSDKVE